METKLRMDESMEHGWVMEMKLSIDGLMDE